MLNVCHVYAKILFSRCKSSSSDSELHSLLSGIFLLLTRINFSLSKKKSNTIYYKHKLV